MVYFLFPISLGTIQIEKIHRENRTKIERATKEECRLFSQNTKLNCTLVEHLEI